MGDVTYEEMFAKAPYYGDSIGIRTCLARVLIRLPKRVRRFVIERCAVLSIDDDTGGIVWPAYIVEPRWVIVLNELLSSEDLLAEDLFAKEEERLIAHEIAHAYLNHDPLTNPDLPEDTEAEANRLVAQWGFPDSSTTK